MKEDGETYSKQSILYKPRLAAKLCSLLAEGRPLIQVCKMKEMPSRKTVYRWIHNYPDFLKMYELAKEDGADALVDEMLVIADDSAGCVQRDRLRVDTRKWAASKFKNKKYGDKIVNEHSGLDGEPITVIQRTIIDEIESEDS